MLHPNFTPFPVLTTDRLILRKLTLQDAPEVFILRSDPVINKYIKREPTANVEAAAEWINKMLNNEKNNIGITWAIVPKGETKLIGSICLWNLEIEDDKAEVGYALHFDYFGKGFMSEALVAVMDYGFHHLKLTCIDAYTNKDNTASRKMLELKKFSRNLPFEEAHVSKEELEYNVVYTLQNPFNTL